VSRLSADDLAAPLASWAAKRCPGWGIETDLAQEATRERLGRLLGGGETPAFLFTAGHGVCYPVGDERQVKGQGALVCSEWSGQGPVDPSQSFGGHNLGPDVGGMITFHFACDSGGTAKFARFTPGPPIERARNAFVADLPQKLLAHPAGGALAVIGHVGSAWKCSINWPGAGRQIQAFEDVVELILNGRSVGEAMEAFGIRYAEQAIAIFDLLQDERDWEILRKDEEIARYWTATHDTRNFVVLGDPAVRLPR
jgi:hypothetical protein